MSLLGTLWMKTSGPNLYEIFRVASSKGGSVMIEKLDPRTMTKIGRARRVSKTSFEADNWKTSGFYPYVEGQ